MRFLQWLGRLCFSNPGWKVLSLISATAIWALVASEPELSTFVTVPVEYKNMPEDLELGSDPVPSVLLEIQGPAGELNGGVIGPTAQVVLDMSRVVPGERTFTVDDRSVKLTNGVRLVRAVPAQLRFLFEKLVTRDVPVEVRTLNDGQQGYYIAARQAHPATLTVTGPASHIAAVRAAETDAIDLSGVVSSKEFQTNAYVLDPLVKIQGTPQIDVKITMKKK